MFRARPNRLTISLIGSALTDATDASLPSSPLLPPSKGLTEGPEFRRRDEVSIHPPTTPGGPWRVSVPSRACVGIPERRSVFAMGADAADGCIQHRQVSRSGSPPMTKDLSADGRWTPSKLQGKGKDAASDVTGPRS